MLLSLLLEGNFNFWSVLAVILANLVVIFLVLPFHEWAHAYVAYLLGDKSIIQRGRLTLNPLSHVDPIGALAIIFLGFGWARPVEIDPRYFKNPKVGMGISALAGPVANFIAALAGGLIFSGLCTFFPQMAFHTVGYYVLMFITYYTQINITLAVFNLIPIPPLDGSKILFMFLPDSAVNFFYRYERIFFIVLFVLVWKDVLPIGLIASYLSNFVYWLTSLPFSFV